MEKTKSLLLIYGLLSIVVTPALAAGPATWSVSQQSQLYGPIRLDIANSGAKLVSRRLSIFMQPNAPTRICNNTEKTYCDVNRDDSSKRLAAYKVTPGKAVKGGSSTIANVKCTQYWCGAFNSKGVMTHTNEFWVTTQLQLPTFVTDKYAKMCGLPTGLGLPLRIQRHFGNVNDPNHEKSVVLDTFRVDKANLPSSNFVPPAGYKRLEDEMAVIMGSEFDELKALSGEGAGASTSLRRPSR